MLRQGWPGVEAACRCMSSVSKSLTWMSCARGAGVWEGMSGRKPRCMTASAAWMPLSPAYGTCVQKQHNLLMPDWLLADLL